MIKRHLRAQNPEALERAMLKNNFERGAFHSYDVMFDGSSWFAWYMVNASDLVREHIESSLMEGVTARGTTK